MSHRCWDDDHYKAGHHDGERGHKNYDQYDHYGSDRQQDYADGYDEAIREERRAEERREEERQEEERAERRAAEQRQYERWQEEQEYEQMMQEEQYPEEPYPEPLIEELQPCPGCGRPEIHKMCPAWGTPKYMSGELFTPEDEIKYAKERQEALEKSEKEPPCSTD